MRPSNITLPTFPYKVSNSSYFEVAAPKEEIPYLGLVTNALFKKIACESNTEEIKKGLHIYLIPRETTSSIWREECEWHE